jgi:hypothetical protein
MELMGQVAAPLYAGQETARVASGFRYPPGMPRIWSKGFQNLNAFELVRVWKAPKDGTVTAGGVASYTGGGSNLQLSIMRVSERADGLGAVGKSRDGWSLESGSVREIPVGGRPAVELELIAKRGALRANVRVQAYPGTSIVRQYVEFENTGSDPLALECPAPFTFRMRQDSADSLTNYWMCGGTSAPNAGQLESARVGASYHRALMGAMTDNYVPWMALVGSGKRDDGCFVALDHLGNWTLSLDCAGGEAILSSSAPVLADYQLPPGKRVQLPLVTLGVFRDDLEDMGRRVYDWQYQYLWDFTKTDYYARAIWVTSWFYCTPNLQEQFAARLAKLDMDADFMRTMGMELMWDDAGWSRSPDWPFPDGYGNVFRPSHEGPDYAETLRYLGKTDMKWLLWIAGQPSIGLLNSKVGSWGNFQYRTDGIGWLSLESDRAFRERIEQFLTANPRCSFHTCNGGSTQAHQFDMQRLADGTISRTQAGAIRLTTTFPTWRSRTNGWT